MIQELRVRPRRPKTARVERESSAAYSTGTHADFEARSNSPKFPVTLDVSLGHPDPNQLHLDRHDHEPKFSQTPRRRQIHVANRGTDSRERKGGPNRLYFVLGQGTV